MIYFNVKEILIITSKGSVMKYILLVLIMLFTVGCSAQDQRALNRAMHDTSVQMQRDDIKQKCESGYYLNNYYGTQKHLEMCGNTPVKLPQNY